MNTATESGKNASAPEITQPNTNRTLVKKANPTEKARRAKKPAATKAKADRANKKAEVIAMMKRAQRATLAEIISATKWQAHTVRGQTLAPDLCDSSSYVNTSLLTPRRKSHCGLSR